MATIPPPPVRGPLTLAPSNVAPPGQSRVEVYFWEILGGKWVSIQGLAAWDAYPAGYYASTWSPQDGNLVPNAWGEHTIVLVVTSRTKPDGSAADYVLDQPPNVNQVPECPPGMYYVFPPIYNIFGDHVPLCALTAAQSTSANCPPGTEWDPIAEICKAIVIPPIVITPPAPTEPPPPPPPPVPGGQPDPYGDEITYDLCLQLQAGFDRVVSSVQQLQQQQGDGAELDACCVAVANAITSVTNSLGLIFNLLSKYTGAPPPTVTVNAPITVNVPPAPPPEITVNAPGTDVSQIVKQLTTIAEQGDVDQAIIDALLQQGLITTADLQVLQGIKWSDAIAYAISSAPVRAVWKFMKMVGADADAIASSIANFAAPGINFAESLVGAALKGERNLLIATISPLIDAAKSAVSPTGVVRLGEIGVNPDKALADVATVMLDLKLMAMLVATMREGLGEQFSKLAENILAIIGLEEIREVQLGPIVRNGMAKVADYQAKAIFRQEIVGVGELVNLVARGILQPSDIAGLLAFNGLTPILEAPLQTAAYRGMNARQLLRLIETGLFTQAEIQDELTFAGVRPVSQARMFHAAPYLATATYRSQLHSALYSAYEAGLLSDSDLTTAVDSAESNFNRDNLILSAMHYRVLVSETKKLETEYANLFKVGLITDATYRADLAGLGLQPGYIDIIAGVTEAAANVASYKKNIAEAAAQARLTANDERKAAIQAFKAGTLNAAGLSTALALTGLTPTQVAARVSQATLQQAGSVRTVFGLQLAPAAAALLKQRVTDISDQIKAGLILPDAAVPMLSALNIPGNWQNAIISAAAASIAAKKAAIDIPVQTS